MKNQLKNKIKILFYIIIFIFNSINIIAKNDDLKVKLKITEDFGCSNCTYVAVKSTIEDINTYLNIPEITIYACREIFALLKSSNLPNNVSLIKLVNDEDVSIPKGLYITNKENYPILYVQDFKSSPILTYIKKLNYGNFYFKNLNTTKIFTDSLEKILTYNSLMFSHENKDSSYTLGIIEQNINEIFIIKNGSIIREVPMLDTIKYFFTQSTKKHLKYEIDYFFSKGYYISSYKKLMGFDDSSFTVLCHSLYDISVSKVFDKRINEYVEANTPQLRGLLLKYNYKDETIEFINELDSSFFDYIAPLYYENKIVFLSDDFYNTLFNHDKSAEHRDSISLLKQIDFADNALETKPLLSSVEINDIINLNQNKVNETISMNLNENIILLNVFDRIFLFDYKSKKTKIFDIPETLRDNSFIKFPYSLCEMMKTKKYTVINNILINDDKIYIFSKYYDESRKINYLIQYDFNFKFEFVSFKVYDMLNLGNYKIIEPYVLFGKICLVGYEDNKNINILNL